MQGLNRLKGHYRLVALSNGEPWFLDHLVKNRIKINFDAVISVEEAGAFKPHPSVYRTGARVLGLEPKEIMMVAAHSFDIMGARASGYRGAFVNRYGLPFEETPYQPDFTVDNFIQLALKGEGIALGFSGLATEMLNDGRLVRPIDASLTRNLAVHVVTPATSPPSPKVQDFIDWIVEEVNAESEK